MDRISVIIPVYDRESLTLRAVESVFAQTLLPDEVLVVDDGSPKAMPRLEAELSQMGGRYIRIEHAGVSRARNVGVSESSGEWLAFLDSDDRWLPEKLETQRRFHQQHPEIRISQTEERWIRNGVVVNACAHHEKPSGSFFTRSLELCCVSPSAVFLQRSLFDELGGFDERLRVCEDYALWIRVAAQEPIGLIPEILIEKYGGHADQLSRAEPAMDRFRVYAMISACREVPLALEQKAAVLHALRTKVSVLRTGAAKRGNAPLLEVLHEVASRIDHGYDEVCRMSEQSMAILLDRDSLQ